MYENMIKPFMVKELQETIHKLDIINKPYILYYNPKDVELLQEVFAIIGEKMVLEKSSLIQSGQVILIDRAKVEDYYKDMSFQYVDYRDIGKDDKYGLECFI